MSETVLSAPQPLTQAHLTAEFDCGEASLNHWLQRRALKNQSLGASRTFVVTDRSNRVLAYYALAAGAVAHNQAASAIKRNMPDPIPVMVLGRLAVDQNTQGMKLGSGLLKDALLRTINVSEQAGIKALLVHALDQKAKAFYQHYGFKESPVDPLVLMLSLKNIDLSNGNG
ncbi:GNAT family N-acetyltransferase [Bacterioplanoides sp.]|uniref:GNAT family N-acetyltransferase n=1 Tax=Bacterioplanoides sp. TaxID=2066072 RepID=UPI003B004476